ncbi:MAG: c-type cytochrome [Campylobacteraceae bacterium]|jgi:cytochrome c553|nr:c-type cytochrome [Campylobacteraceae bacterium]
MFKTTVFLTVLCLCTISFAQDEVTIKATGDFAKEIKKLVEEYQGKDINGSVEIVEITDDNKQESEEEQLENSPIEQAMQEEIKKTGSANSSRETYNQYFSDEKQNDKSIFESIFSSNDKQVSASSGKSIYDKKCASCHGQNAEKSSYLNARNLITLTKDEIIQQVRNYRSDSEYGENTGFLMRSQAIMVNDAQVKDIAEYIDSLKK